MSRRSRGSAIFADAAKRYALMRAEYQDVLENAHQLAEWECNGVLLNARGKSEGVDAYSLFKGTEARAMAYASEELVAHWAKHPRLTAQEFERQWLDTGREDAVA